MPVDLGTRVRRYRCSLPGLAGFTAYRCEGPAWATIRDAQRASNVILLIRPPRVNFFRVTKLIFGLVESDVMSKTAAVQCLP